MPSAVTTTGRAIVMRRAWRPDPPGCLPRHRPAPSARLRPCPARARSAARYARCAGRISPQREIVGVRGDHHAVAGRQIEGLAGREIDARLGLEVAARSRSRGWRPRASRCGARDRPSARCCRSRPAPARSGASAAPARRGTSGQASSRCQAEIEIARDAASARPRNAEARQDALEIVAGAARRACRTECGRSAPPPCRAGIRRARRRRRRASRAHGRAA